MPLRVLGWLLLSLLLLLLLQMMRPQSANAVPAFAQQTGQPCAACHVGAFGPQLKEYGRQFKLNGYVAGDGKYHGLPVAISEQSSFTHTNADKSPPTPHFATNNNFALDQVSVYYAGPHRPLARRLRADHV